jgi:hypothetical protein
MNKIAAKAKLKVASVAHPMKITAQLIMDGLGTGMYVDPDACLWEIIRNAACSHMMDPKEWTPGIGQVDVFLVNDFPMFPGIRTLIVRDYGRGFTEEDMKRLCHIGTPSDLLKKYPGGRYGGASQKGIGRLAAYALNVCCAKNKDTSTGFYILTRSTASGPVKLISLIPDDIEQHQSVFSRTLDEDSEELRVHSVLLLFLTLCMTMSSRSRKVSSGVCLVPQSRVSSSSFKEKGCSLLLLLTKSILQIRGIRSFFVPIKRAKVLMTKVVFGLLTSKPVCVLLMLPA